MKLESIVSWEFVLEKRGKSKWNYINSQYTQASFHETPRAAFVLFIKFSCLSFGEHNNDINLLKDWLSNCHSICCRLRLNPNPIFRSLNFKAKWFIGLYLKHCNCIFRSAYDEHKKRERKCRKKSIFNQKEQFWSGSFMQYFMEWIKTFFLFGLFGEKCTLPKAFNFQSPQQDKNF